MKPHLNMSTASRSRSSGIGDATYSRYLIEEKSVLAQLGWRRFIWIVAGTSTSLDTCSLWIRSSTAPGSNAVMMIDLAPLLCLLFFLFVFLLCFFGFFSC